MVYFYWYRKFTLSFTLGKRRRNERAFFILLQFSWCSFSAIVWVDAATAAVVTASTVVVAAVFAYFVRLLFDYTLSFFFAAFFFAQLVRFDGAVRVRTVNVYACVKFLISFYAFFVLCCVLLILRCFSYSASMVFFLFFLVIFFFILLRSPSLSGWIGFFFSWSFFYIYLFLLLVCFFFRWILYDSRQ